MKTRVRISFAGVNRRDKEAVGLPSPVRYSGVLEVWARVLQGTWSGKAVSCGMFDLFWVWLEQLLGLGRDSMDLEFRHMAWRAVIAFAVAVALARLGARRFLANNAGFDIMLAIVLGSILSRGINGQAAFFPSLGTGILLVALHRVLATFAYQWHWFSVLVKGRPSVLVRDGDVYRDEMCRVKITSADLEESLRLHGNITDPADVAEARLERNGSVSVVCVPGANRRESDSRSTGP